MYLYISCLKDKRSCFLSIYFFYSPLLHLHILLLFSFISSYYLPHLHVSVAWTGNTTSLLSLPSPNYLISLISALCSQFKCKVRPIIPANNKNDAIVSLNYRYYQSTFSSMLRLMVDSLFPFCSHTINQGCNHHRFELFMPRI